MSKTVNYQAGMTGPLGVRDCDGLLRRSWCAQRVASAGENPNHVI